MNSPITMEMSEWAINEIVSSKDTVISCAFIQETVAKYFNIDVKDIIGSKKSNDIVFPRQIAMYLCRNVPQISLPIIGKEFGNRDHTTVMHACRKIEKEINNLAPIEKTINDARTLENLHLLIKNNGHNFDLSNEQIELAQKLNT